MIKLYRLNVVKEVATQEEADKLTLEGFRLPPSAKDSITQVKKVEIKKDSKYANMSYTQLRNQCKNRNLKNYGVLNKSQLIDLLEKNDEIQK